MTTRAKQRFLTILLEGRDEIIALTEMEHFQKTSMIGIDLEEHLQRTYNDDWSDFVWQWATSKEQAIAQHNDKVDAWELDPTKETY